MERYDRVGRLDPNGEYDVSGNVLTDLVNGTSVGGTYDRVGRLDPNGEYDASGNVIGKEEIPKTEETVEKVEEDSEKKKYKLYFPKFIKVVGTSASLAAATAATIFSVKYTGNVQKYEKLKEDNNLRTSSMFDLVNQNTTSLDELLNQNLQEYQRYENFRNLINARRRFLTSKMEMIENYPTYYVDYNSLSVEKISNLDDSFFEYYSRYQLNPSDTDAKENLDRICSEMNSIRKSIDEYEKQYGEEIVESIANKVLASKVVDSKNLNPDYVSNINGKYGATGKLKVSFEYNDNGNKEKYVAVFKNDSYDFAKKIAVDINDENYLDAIHETKILADDARYDNFKVRH